MFSLGLVMSMIEELLSAAEKFDSAFDAFRKLPKATQLDAFLKVAYAIEANEWEKSSDFYFADAYGGHFAVLGSGYFSWSAQENSFHNMGPGNNGNSYMEIGFCYNPGENISQAEAGKVKKLYEHIKQIKSQEKSLKECIETRQIAV